MKPPSQWTPEEARQAEEYARQDPAAADVMSALAEYKIHESKRAELARPDVFTPERRPGGMMGLRTLLPESLYGIATTHQDPSLEDFRKTAKLTPGDDDATAYQDFKDEAWAKAYDEAVKRGTPIHRKTLTKEMEADQAQLGADMQTRREDAVIKPIYGTAVAMGRGLLPGVMDAAKGLMSKKDADFQDSAEASAPELVKDAAGLIGAARSPVLRGVAGLTEKLIPKAGSLVGGLAKGAARGALISNAAGVMDDAGKLTDSLMREHGKESVGSRIADTGANSLMQLPGRSVVGAFLGAPIEAAGGFSEGLRNPSTSAGRGLKAFEETGGKTSVTAPNGLELPPTLEELVRSGGPFEHPTDNAVNRAKPLIAQGAASRIDETVSPIEAENERYYAATKGIKAKMTPMTRTLVDLIKSRSYESTEGGALPMVKNKPLIDELHKTATLSVASLPHAQAMQRAGDVIVPLDEAISSGIIDQATAAQHIDTLNSSKARPGRPTLPPGPDDAAAEAYLGRAGLVGDVKAGLPRLGALTTNGENAVLRGMKGTPPPEGVADIASLDPTHYYAVFSPRELDARAADEVLSAVDRAAGISEAEGAGRADPAFKKLPRAAREVRDQFPPVPGITDKYPDVSITGHDGSPITLTGRSAMAHAHSQQLAGMQRSMKQAGMPSDRFDPTDVLQQDKAGQALFGIGPGVGETNRTAAVMDLAKKTKGGERAIKDVIASRLVNGGELAPKGVGVPSANPERAAAQLAHRYQYKLDPIAQFLGKGAPLAGASSVISDPVTRALLDLAQRTQQQSP